MLANLDVDGCVGEDLPNFDLRDFFDAADHEVDDGLREEAAVRHARTLAAELGGEEDFGFERLSGSVEEAVKGRVKGRLGIAEPVLRMARRSAMY
jgi:hypothetical protein